MASKPRILVVGWLAGELDWFLAKVNGLESKSGPFSCVLLTGGLDGWTTERCLKLGRFAAPVYFAGHTFDGASLPVDLPECNMTYLGPAGSQCIDGLQVVMLAASEPSSLDKEISIAIDQAAVNDPQFKGIDVLVSGVLESTGTVAALARRLSPRFHFCGNVNSQSFSELTFRVHDSPFATRLLSLLPAVKGSKQKWVYATAVVPLKDAAQDVLDEISATSPCPYDVLTSRLSERKKRKRSGPSHPRLDPRANCWFCLENEKDLHLVVMVGKFIFVAMAKGALTPHHVLLVPVDHVRSSLDAPVETLMEIQKFKIALKAMFSTLLDSDVVFMERCIRTTGGDLHDHGHLHAIPVPRGSSHALRTLLDALPNDRTTVKVTEVPPKEAISDFISRSGTSTTNHRYFWIEHSGGYRGVHLLSDSDRHPLEFGRHTVAKLIGKSERSHWRDCVEPDSQEAASVEKFRSVFTKYAPTVG